MLPIRDDNPTFLRPVVTLLFIGINLGVWLLVQGLGSQPEYFHSICRLGLVPGELLQSVPAGTALPGMLAENMLLGCQTGTQPAWHTLVTSMFLHGGWLHLLGNVWFLWVFGNNVEDSMGHARFATFYLLTGVLAAATQVALHPSSVIPMVGASGAISGVMGAYIILYPRVRVHMLTFFILPFRFVVPAWLMLGYWFLLQLVGSIPMVASGGGGVAFAAHAGGFAAGMLLILVFRDRALIARRNQELRWSGWRV